MTLDISTVQKIARLAKLEIDGTEENKYQQELNQILSFVEQLERANIQNVEVMTHPFDATLRMRNDEVTESCQREQFQALAASAEKGLYLVPKVID